MRYAVKEEFETITSLVADGLGQVTAGAGIGNAGRRRLMAGKVTEWNIKRHQTWRRGSKFSILDFPQDTLARDLPELPAPRPSRRNAGSGGHRVDSPQHEPRQSRRHHSSSGAAVDSAVREASEGSRHSRRHRSTAASGGSESQDGGAAVPKRDRPRRKTKGSSSGGGSIRSTSRSNAVVLESEGAVESQSSDSTRSLKTTRVEEGC